MTTQNSLNVKRPSLRLRYNTEHVHYSSLCHIGEWWWTVPTAVRSGKYKVLINNINSNGVDYDFGY